MGIAYADVVPIMIRALPNFRPSEGDLRDSDLPFIFKLHVVRYVCDRASAESDPTLLQFGALLEQLLTEGDTNIHDLVIDTLEDICERVEREKVAFYFGPKVREIWRDICADEH